MVPTLGPTMGVIGHRPVVGTRDCKDLLYAFAAATSFLALNAIKAGVLNAAQLNSNLEIQGRLLGQNITQIRAYDAAFQAAGAAPGSRCCGGPRTTASSRA